MPNGLEIRSSGEIRIGQLFLPCQARFILTLTIVFISISRLTRVVEEDRGFFNLRSCASGNCFLGHAGTKLLFVNSRERDLDSQKRNLSLRTTSSRGIDSYSVVAAYF